MTHETLHESILAKETISGSVFRDFDWAELDAEGVEFRNCTFDKARFNDTIFNDATFHDCIFQDCWFHQSNLDSAEFVDCTFFNGSSAIGADFSHANMQNIRFEKCNLSTSRFASAILYGAHFEDCTAQGANFEAAIFSPSRNSKNNPVRMNNSNLNYAVLRGLSFQHGRLTNCSLRESDLRECDFHNANLSGSDLSGADTYKANFEGADLCGANLSGFLLGNTTGFQNVKILAAQQSDILHGLGIIVL